MNTKKHNWILYLIAATIIATIAIQFYWNYKNYEQNKQQILNEIKASLNNALDEYYTNLSQKNLLTIVQPKTLSSKDSLRKKEIWRDVFSKIAGEKPSDKSDKKADLDVKFSISSIEIKSDEKGKFNKNESSFVKDLIKKTEKKLPKGTTITGVTQLEKNGNKGYSASKKDNEITEIISFRGEKARDSIKLLKGLKTIFITINNDSLAYQDLDSILSKKLTDKKIDILFGFKHFKKDSLFYDYKSDVIGNNIISVNSNSSNFKYNEHLELLHTNPSKEALQRSSTGILLSLFLSLAVISSLFYLLKIINQQKELAEIKNDLISNITHEFKTPITTVSTALEAIDNFNALNDKEKTKKYVSISSVQLKKLHQMVEKLLETATLDSEKLLLKKESVNLVDLIETSTQKHQLITTDKTISFSSNIDEITANIDVFHFENAISNLIDNAVKYGGDKIEVNVNLVLNQLEIGVVDNGNGIEKHQQEKIFDKFYRVPKGNTHDVKGFGIGLYYTKKIIEKHGGNIALIPNSKNTIFKIILPHE